MRMLKIYQDWLVEGEYTDDYFEVEDIQLEMDKVLCFHNDLPKEITMDTLEDYGRTHFDDGGYSFVTPQAYYRILTDVDGKCARSSTPPSTILEDDESWLNYPDTPIEQGIHGANYNLILKEKASD